MQTVSRIVGLTILACTVQCGTAQQTETSPEGTQSHTSAGQCQPRSGVLQDGTFVVRNRDCTTKWMSKEEIINSQSVKADASSPTPEGSTVGRQQKDVTPQPPLPGFADPVMRGKYLTAMNGYYDYHTEGYLHRARVFRWQLISSKIIFLIVTLLVFSGIYFAALQFHEGMRLRTAARLSTPPKEVEGGNALGVNPNSEITKISASAKGIEVSSPILGVIILIISLAFFYLYLVYVYPITELF